MSAEAYPAVMGMFCTGYVLHRAWNAYRLYQHRKQMRRIKLMQFEVNTAFNIVWKDWTPDEIAEVRKAS